MLLEKKLPVQTTITIRFDRNINSINLSLGINRVPLASDPLFVVLFLDCSGSQIVFARII